MRGIARIHGFLNAIRIPPPRIGGCRTCHPHWPDAFRAQSGPYRLNRTPCLSSLPRTYSFISRNDETIYALSTPSGASAIAVIRISGPACVEICRALSPNLKLPKPRYASLRTLYEPSVPPSVESILDPGALVLYFPAPNTVTGEDVLELHIHGGPATIKATLSAIPRALASSSSSPAPTGPTPSSSRLAIRYAQPGEFTRRAFQNCRLSLPQIEALSATLTAQTEQQRRIAARGSRSSLGDLYESWRSQLLHARAELEALIDFAEDQHFDESPRQLASNVARMVGKLVRQMHLHRENAIRGEMLRSGIQVALLGAPNAGKSSLLNRIVGREAAIVSREAGTTRDVIEVGVDLGGWYAKFGDMAGLRVGSGKVGNEHAVGEVEQEGIRRAKERALQSDVIIVVVPVESSPDGAEPTLHVDPEVISTAMECIAQGRSILVAINKTDKLPSGRSASPLLSTWQKSMQELLFVEAKQVFGISCKADESALAASGQSGSCSSGNVQSLLRGLTETFQTLTRPLTPEIVADTDADINTEDQLAQDTSICHDSIGASERQRLLLEECMGHLESFLALTVSSANVSTDSGRASGVAEEELDVVVAAESLRVAAECLARITGRGEAGDVEEVLGVVFEKFCVGK